MGGIPGAACGGADRDLWVLRHPEASLGVADQEHSAARLQDVVHSPQRQLAVGAMQRLCKRNRLKAAKPEL
jgi:hypothetical protein